MSLLKGCVQDEETPQDLPNPYAVALGNDIVLFRRKYPLERSTLVTKLWTYSLDEEIWSHHDFQPSRNIPYGLNNSCVVAVNSRNEIYVHGGQDEHKCDSNKMYQLAKLSSGFSWHRIPQRKTPLDPSPRAKHYGWEYDNKVWIFGGKGTRPDGYMHEHGSFEYCTFFFHATFNNQLLCFDPATKTWSNPECTGCVPSPRGYIGDMLPLGTVAQIGQSVYLAGGIGQDHYMPKYDVYHLDMRSLTWTHIINNMMNYTSARVLYSYSLHVINEHTLLLFQPGMAWYEGSFFLDTRSLTWSRFTKVDSIPEINASTVVTVPEPAILQFGGFVDNPLGSVVNTVNVIRLQPASLQTLCMNAVLEGATPRESGEIPEKIEEKLKILDMQRKWTQRHSLKLDL